MSISGAADDLLEAIRQWQSNSDKNRHHREVCAKYFSFYVELGGTLVDEYRPEKVYLPNCYRAFGLILAARELGDSPASCEAWAAACDACVASFNGSSR